jgi:hypothetical protein
MSAQTHAHGEQLMVAESSAGLGAVLFPIGGLLYFWQVKRVFDRTNQFGVEQFSVFWGKLVAKAKDKPIFGIAITLLFGGLLAVAFAYEATWGWIVLLPVYLFILFLVVGA